MTLAGIELELVRKDIKNLHLAVYPPDGRVRLAAPHSTDEETLEMYVATKIPWIRRQQREIEAQPRQSERQFLDRESHYFLGHRYLLRVLPLEAGMHWGQVVPKGKRYLNLHVEDQGNLEAKRRIIEKWYRRELRSMLEELVPAWEAKLGVQAKGWRIRGMRTKWGSCNPDNGTMLFNLELARQPLDCIEYVVAHELAHLIERKHNDRFVAVLDAHLPQWRHLRETMKSLPVIS